MFPASYGAADRGAGRAAAWACRSLAAARLDRAGLDRAQGAARLAAPRLPRRVRRGAPSGDEGIRVDGGCARRRPWRRPESPRGGRSLGTVRRLVAYRRDSSPEAAPAAWHPLASIRAPRRRGHRPQRHPHHHRPPHALRHRRRPRPAAFRASHQGSRDQRALGRAQPRRPPSSLPAAPGREERPNGAQPARGGRGYDQERPRGPLSRSCRAELPAPATDERRRRGLRGRLRLARTAPDHRSRRLGDAQDQGRLRARPGEEPRPPGGRLALRAGDLPPVARRLLARRYGSDP
jgi:hypothetical protein